jgi:hypothetical protein
VDDETPLAPRPLGLAVVAWANVGLAAVASAWLTWWGTHRYDDRPGDPTIVIFAYLGAPVLFLVWIASLGAIWASIAMWRGRVNGRIGSMALLWVGASAILGIGLMGTPWVLPVLLYFAFASWTLVKPDAKRFCCIE